MGKRATEKLTAQRKFGVVSAKAQVTQTKPAERSTDSALSALVPKMTVAAIERVVEEMATGELREKKTSLSAHRQKIPAGQRNSCRSREMD